MCEFHSLHVTLQRSE